VPLVIGGSGAGSALTLESTSGAGTTDSIVFKTGSQSTRLIIGTQGNLAVNTTVNASDRLLIEDGTGSNQLHIRYTGKTGCIFNQISTGGASFNLQDNNNLDFYTNNGSGADLRLYASGGASLGLTPVDVGANNLYVQGGVSLATSTAAAAGALLANSSVKSQSPSAGIGYSTGAGSTVTQLTGRTTGVTINAVSGAITLFSQVNTAVSGATAQTFTVTNSSVAATDTIIVNQKSGTDKYLTFVTNVAAGSFQITNYTTGGTTNEAPVFSFNVIKGVTS
jgi:hypothetical protein